MESIYLVTLQKDIISPLAKENEAEELKEKEPKEDKKRRNHKARSKNRLGRF
jgi:tricorn protease